MLNRVSSNFLLAVALSVSGAAADEVTLDEVIARHMEARGGVERIHRVQSVRFVGRVSFDGKDQGSFRLEQQRPNLMRIEMAIGGEAMVQGFDGTRGFVVDPLRGAREGVVFPPGEPADLALQADIEGPLADWRRKGLELALKGTDEVRGVAVWRVRMKLPQGSVRWLLFDQGTHQLVKSEGWQGGDDDGFLLETYFSDFRDVGGVRYPFRIESSPHGEPGGQTIRYESGELDVALAASRFAAPKGARPAGPPPAR